MFYSEFNTNVIVMNPIEYLYTYLQPHYLTIDDIEKMAENEQLDIFFIDRNVMDLSNDIRETQFLYTPQEFFSNCYYIKFTKTQGLRGKWQWKFDNTEDELREFDIDLDDFWYPLINDTVPELDTQLFYYIQDKFAGKHWSELEKTRNIGWRGPMVRESVLLENPNIRIKKEPILSCE